MITAIERLEELQPLFRAHWPDGRKDFRGMTWPCEWRGGLYRHVTDKRCKALFGNQQDCQSAALYLNSLGINSTSLAPHISGEMECDGEPIGRTRTDWWELHFSIPDGFRL